jgi:leucyl aminopeptidase
MNFATESNIAKRKHADLVVLPFWKGDKEAVAAAEVGTLQKLANLPIHGKDFTGKEGEVIVLFTGEGPEPRVALLGLGEKEKITVEKLRRAYSNVTQKAHSSKAISMNIIFPHIESLDESDIARGLSEGILLTNYVFDKLHHEKVKKERKVLLEKITFVGAGKKALESATKYSKIIEGVYLARDLINSNADDMTPQALSNEAKSLAKKFANVKATVFDKKRIEKEKMGLLLAVNQGSSIDPAFIILEYKGNPKSKDLTVVVGKGVTYDTGGLNLKPTGSMETMKCDMSGAACALGTIHAAASLGLKVNLTAVIPSTDNSIDSKSYKPGDVYQSYLGKTVEIGNTDAEGRLILADALAYSVKNLKPTRMINFATLTGACVIALGEETTGLMSNNDHLAESISRAGNETFERAWRLPLFEEYRSQLDSDIADISNVGGREAGTITAALFLQEFVGSTPWAHLDIAGTAFLKKARRYHPKYGTGVGVRLMIELLENL